MYMTVFVKDSTATVIYTYGQTLSLPDAFPIFSVIGGWLEDHAVGSSRHGQARSPDLGGRLAFTAHWRGDGLLGAGPPRGYHDEAVVLCEPRRQEDLARVQYRPRPRCDKRRRT